MTTPKSQVARKVSILDMVAQEKTKIEAILEELGISRKMHVSSQVKKVLKSQLMRIITSVDGSKKKGTDGERQVNLSNPPGVDCTGLPESTTSRKLARTFPKKKMLKRPSTFETTGSEVEETARLAALHGVEKMSKTVTRLMKGICLGVEKERAEMKRKKVKLKRNVARLKTDLLKEGKWMESLKALQVVEINNQHAEAKTNFEEVVAEHDRLRRHLMLKRYFVDEVDAIKADTYVEEEVDEEIKDITVGIVDGLDGVSPQTVGGNEWNHNEHLEGETEKVE
ncbi:hypothetical protein GIB67_029511 [Kingdonia uniflora]|uniref:Uncharacterized protein n=1 Tax=Kingdonia uniflora TaxID=39325 RepID=A0A7J7NYE0_9MAGN|nr:hypothetical protein GIB67_029511 [Kingdonia uniflora]